MIDDKQNYFQLNIDFSNLPETEECLEVLFAAEEVSPYAMASALVRCDRTVDMPKELFDFIVSLYKTAIDEGNADAMNDLGALYYDGRGCSQDFTKAVFYFDMAAKAGDLHAQENLGYCYYYGRDMPVDYEKAFHYFALGAFNGQPVSLYKIGDMYQNGYYVEKNPKEAFRIYLHCLTLITDENAASAAGPIYLRMGNALVNGIGVDENPKDALVAFQHAEAYLYDMVKGGEVMYKKSLQAAIDGQAKAREKLSEDLPKQEWKHE